MQQVDKGGSIVAIASIAGIRVAARAAAYAASKAGIIHLTKVLAYEWAPYGIRVNAIAPGYFETEMTQDLLATERGKAIIGRIPMGRVGQVTDLDGPLMLLASDASSYMTGTVIAVDGGHLVLTLSERGRCQAIATARRIFRRPAARIVRRGVHRGSCSRR
jgi:NAD(P)-dependent dehydrogenase (short-subunit alcohol dehydrogenase family)